MNFFLTSFDTRKLRYQTIGITLLLLMILIVLQQFIAYHQFNRLVNDKIATKNQQAQIFYNYMMQERFKIQLAAIKENLSSKAVQDAIVSRDRDQLYTLLSRRYNVLHHTFPYFNIMHIVLPDNRSFLRLHQPQSYGDDLSGIRPMHHVVNRQKTWLHGLEVGRYGISYRTVVPIIYNNIHYGNFEIGSPVQQVIKDLAELLGLNIILTINKKHLSIAQHPLPPSYDAQRNIIFASKLFHSLHVDLYTKKPVAYDNETYMIEPGIKLYNFSGEAIGEFFYAFNITHELEKKHDYIAASFLIGAIVMILIILLLSYNFNKITGKLNESERYSHLILNTQKNIIFVTSGKHLIDGNNAFLNFFQYGSVAAFKKHHQCVCHLFQEHSASEYITGETKEGMNWIEYIIKHPNIEHKCRISLHQKEHIFALKADATTMKKRSIVVVTLQDITKLERHNRELEQISQTDALTKIYNRTFYHTIAAKLYDSGEMTSLSVIFLDIDHFKNINDTYGHDYGDSVLKKVTALISSIIRNSDYFIRWGGEEFLLLLPNSNHDNALKLCEKLRSRIAALSFNKIGHVTCSFGVTQRRIDDDENSVLKRADDALYRAKKNGRNRVESL